MFAFTACSKNIVSFFLNAGSLSLSLRVAAPAAARDPVDLVGVITHVSPCFVQLTSEGGGMQPQAPTAYFANGDAQV